MILEYEPKYYSSLQNAVERLNLSSSNLSHRAFVDHYYAGSDWCKLFLAMDDEESVVGMIGVDLMRFEVGSRETCIGFGSNWYTLQPIVGAGLLRKWLDSCDLGAAYGGSPYVQSNLHKLHWTYPTGVRTYYLSPRRSFQTKRSWWSIVTKFARGPAFRKMIASPSSRILGTDLAGVSVREEFTYHEDLVSRQSPFPFRLAPNLDYLSWRYSLNVSFVRYRLFRILMGKKSIGYVIINDLPERIVISHCDGDEPTSLAYGVLLALLEVAGTDEILRTVYLTSCHPEMQCAYEIFGFKEAPPNGRPFALGNLRRDVDLLDDASGWLINYDLSDNGMRPPFWT